MTEHYLMSEETGGSLEVKYEDQLKQRMVIAVRKCEQARINGNSRAFTQSFNELKELYKQIS